MTRSIPAEILARARGLVESPSRQTRGLWARAAALLARQALEACLSSLWSKHAPALAELPFATQFVCLREFTADTRLAQRAGHTWGALSAACHYQSYGVEPTAAELRSWLAVVEALVSWVGGSGEGD